MTNEKDNILALANKRAGNIVGSTDSPVIPGEIVGVKPVDVLEPPFNAVIVAQGKLQNMGDVTQEDTSEFRQTITAATEIINIKKEDGEVPLRSLTDNKKAKTYKVAKIPTTPEVEAARQRNSQGIIATERGAYVWQGQTTILIADANLKVNPITGEALTLPEQALEASLTSNNPAPLNNLVQFPSPTPRFEQPTVQSQPVNNNEDNLRQFIRTIQPEDLKAA